MKNKNTQPNERNFIITGQSRQRLSLEKCKAILNKNGLEYSDEQIIQIRDFLDKFIDISVEHYEREALKAKVINLNPSTENEQKESIPLYQGEYRRAS